VASITFSALNLAQFNDAAFDTAFRTELSTTIAAAAGVEVWRVSVTSVAAGSVVASLLVQFPLGWEVQRDVFVVSLATNTASVLASSSTLLTYGDVQAVVFAPPPSPPPPRLPSPPPPSSPVKQDTASEGMDLALVVGVAGGALLMAGVAVGGCCWGGCCRKRKKQAARHAMSHHLVHPLPQAASVQAFGYPSSAPACHVTAYPDEEMTLEDL
jgi:hypothetical protein